MAENRTNMRPPKGARVPTKVNGKTVKRLLSYLKPYTPHLIVVVVCILITAAASVSSSLFLQTLIDDYILPLVGTANPDYSGLLRAILKIAVLFVAGALAALLHSRIMATVAQGALKTIRQKMFSHMQSLPIRYFDTHSHGNVMSFYTNDCDAMEQMLSQSIPQAISSLVTIVSVFASMLSISVWLTLAGAERIFSLLDEEPEPDNGYVTLVNAKYENGELVETDEVTHIWAWKHPHSDGTLTYTEVKGDITMDDVDFGYVPEKTVLHNIDLYAEPGQKIAFVGATGAGKTTITNLINRFYDIDDGKIRYDGININKIKKADLRRSLGVVLQEVNLFTGTVMDNLRYGKPNATDEECIAAAKLANADGFIHMLPEGYNTVLHGGGSELSQGQRQLLSIARAAVADPPVMILDEATSSIDTHTEAIVQAGMDALMHGRTVFVIAHRLSTVMNSDVIMVLDHGKIIERGSHEKLIAEKGQYYKLYTGAFELE